MMETYHNTMAATGFHKYKQINISLLKSYGVLCLPTVGLNLVHTVMHNNNKGPTMNADDSHFC